jgi:hypothetical protein
VNFTTVEPISSTCPTTAIMSRTAQQQQQGSRKISFNVSEQYDIQDVVGEGAYGVVCSALHKPSGQKVAIKKISPFDHSMFAVWTSHLQLLPEKHLTY